jgi:transcriptional regulator
MTGPFDRFDATDVRALIAEYPLAWVVARGADGDGSLLPLIGVHDEAGRLVELIGHLARSNPLHGALTADPRAVVMFRGPQAYVSPEHAGRRDWGPTWNYVQLTVHGELTFEPEQTGRALDILTDAVEGQRPAPWRSDELGARYEGMLARIIGFRVRVDEVRGKFKLGQDEDVDTLRAILGAHPDPEMRAWMRRANKARL